MSLSHSRKLFVEPVHAADEEDAVDPRLRQNLSHLRQTASPGGRDIWSFGSRRLRWTYALSAGKSSHLIGVLIGEERGVDELDPLALLPGVGVREIENERGDARVPTEPQDDVRPLHDGLDHGRRCQVDIRVRVGANRAGTLASRV